MTQKPKLPAAGGSYLRDGDTLKCVEEPTVEQPRGADNPPVKKASKETSK